MNLAFVTNGLDVGGVETSLVGLADELTRLGDHVTVVSSGGALEPDLASTGARHVRVPLSLRDPVSLVMSPARVSAAVQGAEADVAHAMSAAASVALGFARRRRSCLYVASPMGLENSDREPRWVGGVRDRLVAFRAQHVLVISRQIERRMLEVGVPERRLVRCNVNGVDIEAFERAAADRDLSRAEMAVTPDEVLVTTVGALHPRKSHDLFLSAAAIVLRALPSARFAIVGSGPDWDRLHRVADGLGISDRVIFTGVRRDIPRVMAATDVYVKPGVLEGFIGITVLEAMASGVPVVAFDTQDVRDAIDPERSGLLARLGDTRELARAIERVAIDPVLRLRLIATAKDLVDARFARRSVAQQLRTTYEALRNSSVESAAS